MKVLITGVAGFIGSHVAEECLKLGMEVVGVDDLGAGKRENVPEGVKFIREDAGSLDVSGVRLDAIYHFAAYAAEARSHERRAYTFIENTFTSSQVIERAIERNKHRPVRFVFASSIAVYGEQEPPFVETMTPKPIDPYGISKYATELDLQAAQRVYGLNYTIFRPHNVYGERQNMDDPDRNVVAIWMRQLLEGKPMTIYGDGEQRRAFTYIKDVVGAIARAPMIEAARNEIFNVGEHFSISINDMAARVRKVMGGGDVVHLPHRNEVRDAFSKDTRVCRAFGPQGMTPTTDGLQRTAAWAKEIYARPIRNA